MRALFAAAFCLVLASCKTMDWPRDIEPGDAVKTREAAVEFASRVCRAPHDFRIDEAHIYRLGNRWIIDWEGRYGYTLQAEVDKTSGKVLGCYSAG